MQHMISILTHDFLKQEYWDKKKSLYRIEKEIGINRKILLDYMIKFKLTPLRSKSKAYFVSGQTSPMKGRSLKKEREARFKKKIENFTSIYITIGNILAKRFFGVSFTKEFSKLIIPTSKISIFINDEVSLNVPEDYKILEIKTNDVNNKVITIVEIIIKAIKNKKLPQYSFIEI